MNCCFIALGSNLSQPLEQVNRAITELATLPGSALQAVSPWYQSAAIGPGHQPDYINGVAKLISTLAPIELLSQLQYIEQIHKRRRIIHWGPRTLDLDILLYNDDIINEPTLRVPHPRMFERNFVIYPLFDIAPELRLPDGRQLRYYRELCSSDGLQLLSSSTMASVENPTVNFNELTTGDKL